VVPRTTDHMKLPLGLSSSWSLRTPRRQIMAENFHPLQISKETAQVQDRIE
jgi:hypothetical protein